MKKFKLSINGNDALFENGNKVLHLDDLFMLDLPFEIIDLIYDALLHNVTFIRANEYAIAIKNL